MLSFHNNSDWVKKFSLMFIILTAICLTGIAVTIAMFLYLMSVFILV